jgi:muramidase (phage lysozyme)
VAGLQDYLENPNVRKLLDTIAYAEGTAGKEGYRTQYTGSLFDNSKGWQHPRQLKGGGGSPTSDAAGRYQFLSTTWDGIAKQHGLTDFSPRNQDIAALALIQGRGVNLDDVAKGGLTRQIADRLAPEWASFPTIKTGTSYYGQGGKSWDELNGFYRKGGPASASRPTGAPAPAASPAPTPGAPAAVVAAPAPASEPFVAKETPVWLQDLQNEVLSNAGRDVQFDPIDVGAVIGLGGGASGASALATEALNMRPAAGPQFIDQLTGRTADLRRFL